MVSDMPETRFTRSGDVAIAYQVTGPAAGFDLVFVSGWVSHLEVMWELPEFARFLDRLAAMGRLILFDMRGTGFLTRVAGMPTLEQWGGRHPAVMDATGCGYRGRRPRPAGRGQRKGQVGHAHGVIGYQHLVDPVGGHRRRDADPV
jgi:pimeloyl-ACP methyl ester carboxylesterase